MDPLHHRLLAALGRTHRAGHGGQRRRGHPARHLLVAGRGDLDLHVDRRDVRPQADPLHRPPQPPATIDAEAHPHGRAAYRGEVAFAVLQGAARRPGAAALFGQDVAHGAVARRAYAGPARDHRQHDLRHRRGDPLAARNFEQPFAAGAQRFRTGARHPELHLAQRGAAQRAHPLHDQPARGTVRHRHRGDPLPRGVRTDKQLAQTLGLQRDQPVALVGRPTRATG